MNVETSGAGEWAKASLVSPPNNKKFCPAASARNCCWIGCSTQDEYIFASACSIGAAHFKLSQHCLALRCPSLLTWYGITNVIKVLQHFLWEDVQCHHQTSASHGIANVINVLQHFPQEDVPCLHQTSTSHGIDWVVCVHQLLNHSRYPYSSAYDG